MADRKLGIRTYLGVYAALLALLAATTALAFRDLKALATPVALSIAALKALLVLWYFMHLRGSSRLVWLFAGAGLYWLSILLSLTLTELLTRPWLAPVVGSRP